MTTPALSKDYLREILDYDPETGMFHWKAGSRKGNRAGGRHLATGYERIKICRKSLGINRSMESHRLAFAWMLGHIPKEIDHIDGDRRNNQWSNLRAVSRSENKKNSSLDPRNKSGVNGVHWNKSARKWRASIKSNGKKIYLGDFSRLDDAKNARLAAEKEFGFSPRHGKERTKWPKERAAIRQAEMLAWQ